MFLPWQRVSVALPRSEWHGNAAHKDGDKDGDKTGLMAANLAIAVETEPDRSNGRYERPSGVRSGRPDGAGNRCITGNRLHNLSKGTLDTSTLRPIIDALPSLVLLVDADLTVHDCNLAAEKLIGPQTSVFLKRRGGDVLHCIHSVESPGGCGHSLPCRTCIIRNSVRRAFQGEATMRHRMALQVEQDGRTLDLQTFLSVSALPGDHDGFALLVMEDITPIAQISALIPICCVCRKVQDETRAWSRIEVYLNSHWDLAFSHGFCPDCYRQEVARLSPQMCTERLLG